MNVRAKRLEKISDNTFLVHGENRARFPCSHSIIIFDKETVLIDTGCGIETLKRLRAEYNVDYVVNSHTHPDHSAGNWVFRGRPIFVPEEGFDTSGDVIALSRRFAGKRLARYWQEFVKKKTSFKNCRPTHSFNRQTTFDFGKVILKPVYTPGHTRDHYCFYEERERILFSFDYDFTPFPWYGHEESSLQKFEASLSRLKSLNPKIVVSSHRGIVTENICAEFSNFLGTIRERDQRILSLLRSEKSLRQLVESAPIYRRFPYARSLLQYWEGQMIKKHLKQLQAAGKVKRCGSFYSRILDK